MFPTLDDAPQELRVLCSCRGQLGRDGGQEDEAMMEMDGDDGLMIISFINRYR